MMRSWLWKVFAIGLLAVVASSTSLADSPSAPTRAKLRGAFDPSHGSYLEHLKDWQQKNIEDFKDAQEMLLVYENMAHGWSKLGQKNYMSRADQVVDLQKQVISLRRRQVALMADRLTERRVWEDLPHNPIRRLAVWYLTPPGIRANLPEIYYEEYKNGEKIYQLEREIRENLFSGDLSRPATSPAR